MQALLHYRSLADVAAEALLLNNLGAQLYEMGDCESAATHLAAGPRAV